MLEEAIIFIYEDSMQGNAFRHTELVHFLFTALDFIELAISKLFQEYFPCVRVCLTRVQQRLTTLLQKKENAILRHFMQNLDGADESMASEPEETSELIKLQELRMTSPVLADFASRLGLKLRKMDAVTDFTEQHEQKFARLFNTHLTQLAPMQAAKSEIDNMDDYDVQSQLSELHSQQMQQTPKTYQTQQAQRKDEPYLLSNY